MSDDEKRTPRLADSDRAATRNDLTIVVGHAQIVRRRTRAGSWTTEGELIDHMDAIIKAALRLGARLDIHYHDGKPAIRRRPGPPGEDS